MPDPSRRKNRPEEPLNLEQLMGNKPPQALDVEEAVLGAMLVEPATIDESMEELTASCFYDPQHRMIFEAMAELVNEHVSIDLVTVSEKLRSKGNLAVVGIYNGDSCGGCFNTITPQRRVEIASNRKLIICEHCGRIIINPDFDK